MNENKTNINWEITTYEKLPIKAFNHISFYILQVKNDKILNKVAVVTTYEKLLYKKVKILKIEDLKKDYDKLQIKYGAKELDSIYNGGCEENPDICFVFMNPTGKNIASDKSWKGRKSPWLGTKNIWKLFYKVDLLSEETFNKIQEKKPKEWDYEFCNYVYEEIEKNKLFITNLGKCTQIDARPLPDEVLKKYLDLLFKEINIIKPKIIITFGNQVSSIILNKKISVSENRKKCHKIEINKNKYKVYPVYYPVGNGIFNIDKSIEDIKWIIENEIKKEEQNLLCEILQKVEILR